MATITVRNVPLDTVESLKALAHEKGHSMEQEIREMLCEYLGDRQALLMQIEAAWIRQTRRPSTEEIDNWIEAGRL